MLRDIVYVTEDYSIRVVDAIIQFHYWLPYVKKNISDGMFFELYKESFKFFTLTFLDMSKCDHRMWIELNGPELHIYNRSKLYSKLEEHFGLDSQIIPREEKIDDEDNIPDGPVKDMSFWSCWRDLVPVIKIDLNMV